MSKEWNGNSKSSFTTIGATGHGTYDRVADDYYATHPKAVDALKYANKLPKSNPVWEPAAGCGSLSKTLIGHGYDVISTDLYDRGYGQSGIDFLSTNELLAPCIFTNPPYKYASDFCIHAIELGADEVYMFVKITFLEGKQRYSNLFSKYPPAEVLQFVERMIVARNGDYAYYDKPSAMAFCWMIWRKGFTGKTTIDWISADKNIIKEHAL